MKKKKTGLFFIVFLLIITFISYFLISYIKLSFDKEIDEHFSNKIVKESVIEKEKFNLRYSNVYVREDNGKLIISFIGYGELDPQKVNFSILTKNKKKKDLESQKNIIVNILMDNGIDEKHIDVSKRGTDKSRDEKYYVISTPNLDVTNLKNILSQVLIQNTNYFSLEFSDYKEEDLNVVIKEMKEKTKGLAEEYIDKNKGTISLLSESYIPEEDIDNEEYSGSDANIDIHKIIVPIHAKIEYQIKK
jgi:hypothetical protein